MNRRSNYGRSKYGDGRSSIPFIVNKNVHKIYTAYHLQYIIYGIMTWNDRFRRV